MGSRVMGMQQMAQEAERKIKRRMTVVQKAAWYMGASDAS